MELNPKSTKVAVSLIVASFLMWTGFIVIPFLPITVFWKVASAGVLFFAAEAVFWIGAIIIGADVAKKVWPQIVERVGSWFKK